jgi:hypothetical protein
VIGGVMKIKRLPHGGTRVHSVCPQDGGAARFRKDHDARQSDA